jgi:hypothetical protein
VETHPSMWRLLRRQLKKGIDTVFDTKRYTLKYPSLIFAFAFIFLLCSCDAATQPTKAIASPYQTISPAGKEFLSGKEIGDQLIKAIEEYKHTYGNYPESLSELIPEFLYSIPLTMTGQEFSYKILDPSVKSLPYGLCFVITQNINTLCCNSK